jgi:hypothetical protein
MSYYRVSTMSHTIPMLKSKRKHHMVEVPSHIKQIGLKPQQAYFLCSFFKNAIEKKLTVLKLCLYHIDCYKMDCLYPTKREIKFVFCTRNCFEGRVVFVNDGSLLIPLLLLCHLELKLIAVLREFSLHGENP